MRLTLYWFIMIVVCRSELKKISVLALSNLNPHPAYVFVHYSRPTLLQRIEHISK
ncbi:MAG: hypothetical protein ACOYOT_07585 [Bacteroidales bacterium]